MEGLTMPDGPIFGMFPIPEPDPEEQQRRREQREQAMLEAHVIHQDIVEFFDSLSVEQAKAFHTMMLHATMENSSAMRDCIHWLGYAASILEQRYKVCSCGEDHADEFLKSLGRDRSHGEE